MDALVTAALEEVCARLSPGIPVADLWLALRVAAGAAGLPLGPPVKRVLWARLLALPVISLVEGAGDGAPVAAGDPAERDVEEAERRGVRLVASSAIRDNFLGMYERRFAKSDLSAVQKAALECVAASRTSGVTQSDLCKNFRMKGNNFHFIVKSLESQRLIVKQSTIIKVKDHGPDGADGSQSKQITNTNSLYLSRYAKELNMNSHQRIEIIKPELLGTNEESNIDTLQEDGAFGVNFKNDVSIHDYLPAMKAICDKLDQASGKALVVSDIKIDLDYRMAYGHRAWRNILHRLKDAGLVQEFDASVDDKIVHCLRLLKKFDPNDFQPKNTASSYKYGKKGQATDQVMELPLENCIYDMISAQGAKGITLVEIGRRLGYNNTKRLHKRISSMLQKFNLTWESEVPDKTSQYRVWTSKNFLLYKAGTALQSLEELPQDSDNHSDLWSLVPSKRMDSLSPEGDLFVDNKLLLQAASHDHTDGHHLQNNFDSCGAVCQSVSEDKLPLGQRKRRRRPPSTSDERRYQRILHMLEKKKFVLKVELHKWLEKLEKKNGKSMDRKTLTRTLNKLQQDGTCRCIRVSVPLVTNYTRSRLIDVILYSSVGDLSRELVDQIRIRQRNFDAETRSGAAAKIKKNQNMTAVPGLRISRRVKVKKPLLLEAMNANGFVGAKMVRVKLFHKFLWSYVSSLPNWRKAFDCAEEAYSDKNHSQSCLLFSMAAATKDMPLELFLQVVGSAKKIDNMITKCRLGKTLSEIPTKEYNLLMDTHARSRLSRLVNILDKLKLVQLAKEPLEDVGLPSYEVPTHLMELRPYIEEPIPIFFPSSQANSHQKIRHDFLLSKHEFVDAYWETLEYCYGLAETSSSFPGCAVPEVSHRKSWSSIRVMTTEQRVELQQRIMNVSEKGKIPFKDCIRIARELNLSVEKVLRVSYARQSHLKEQNSAPATQKEPRVNSRLTYQRKKRSADQITLKFIKQKTQVNGTAEHISGKSSLTDEVPDRFSKYHEDDDAEGSPMISRTILRKSFMRSKRFLWTYESDRKLLMTYTRFRAMHGARSTRVDWTSLSDLPAPPRTCRRRVALLKKNEHITIAVSRICNLLGKRYARYLEKERDWKRTILLHQISNTIQENSLDTDSEQFNWDNFEDPEIKRAFDDVLELIRAEKMDQIKRFGHKNERSNTNGNEVTEDITCSQQILSNQVTGGTSKNTNVTEASKSMDICCVSHEKVNKINKNKFSERDLCKSLAIANALELLKLYFLSTSSRSDVQASLEATLQLYSESEIFTAFSFLKEKNYMVSGNGTKPFTLSRPFFVNLSHSPFPFGSGKKASEFSNWLVAQQTNAKENEVFLYPDLECGEIIHLFSLVFSGELFMSPFIPAEGVGEADEANSSNPSVEDTDGLDDSARKRRPDTMKMKRGKTKKHKPLPKIESDFCYRREKGFPGIQVALTQDRIHTSNVALTQDRIQTHHIQVPHSNECLIFTSSKAISVKNVNLHVENNNIPSFSNNHSSYRHLLSSSDLEESYSGWPWDVMVKYAKELPLVSNDQNESFALSSEQFRKAFSAVHQAGEQGVSLRELLHALDPLGISWINVIVDTLMSFKMATKVNAYDGVQIVDSLHMSKYHITTLVDCNHDCCSGATASQPMDIVDPKNMLRQKNAIPHNFLGTTKVLADGHTVTVINVKSTSAQICSENLRDEGQPTAREDNKESNSYHARGRHMYQPILPWLNGDGTTNSTIYEGLSRRVIGYVMQYPGILEEDVINRMDVLNPQTCRTLLDKLTSDKHLNVVVFDEPLPTAPTILRSLFQQDPPREPSKCKKRYFANPVSTFLL